MELFVEGIRVSVRVSISRWKWFNPRLSLKVVTHLSGETRKVETDRVAVGTFSGEGLSLVFQEFQERFFSTSADAMWAECPGHH